MSCDWGLSHTSWLWILPTNGDSLIYILCFIWRSLFACDVNSFLLAFPEQNRELADVSPSCCICSVLYYSVLLWSFSFRILTCSLRELVSCQTFYETVQTLHVEIFAKVLTFPVYFQNHHAHDVILCLPNHNSHAPSFCPPAVIGQWPQIISDLKGQLQTGVCWQSALVHN